MTFVVVYPTECLLELLEVVLRTFWKKIKFCMLCARKQICRQFHDTFVRVPWILHISGWYQLQNSVWGWKSGKWERRQMWKVLSRKSGKRNSYYTTLNFFLNYLFLPVNTILTVWSECSFCDLCCLFKSGIRVYVRQFWLLCTCGWIDTLKPLDSSQDHLPLCSKWTFLSYYFLATDTVLGCQYMILYVNLYSVLGWVFKFSAWFMKSMLFGYEKIKLWNKWHFLENKMDYAAHLQNALYFPVA
jgi:hypothetical protein